MSGPQHPRCARLRPARMVSGLLLAALLAGCGGNDDAQQQRRGAPASASDVATLPAPAPGGGSVTGAPPPPAPGEVSLGDEPVQDAWIETAGVDGLPPLEDNPEAGLAELVPIVPAPAGAADNAPAVSATAGMPSTTAPADASPQAAAVVQAYYAAIGSRDYRRAYALWSDGGRASGQSPEQFAAGFADTRSVEVQVGTSGAPDGAAGSQYVRVPVSVVATQADGSTRRFAGQYTLRRAMADGAGSQAWRIASAELREERL